MSPVAVLRLRQQVVVRSRAVSLRCGCARTNRGEHKRFTHRAREVMSYLGLLSVVRGFEQDTLRVCTPPIILTRRGAWG